MSHSLGRRLLFVGFCLTAAAALPLLGRADGDAPAGRQYAFLVGVKNYNKDELRNLEYTENDVNDLAEVLKGAGYKRVVVLTQSAAADLRDNNLLPTGRNIRLQLQSLLDDRKPGDAVLVAFSGHGVQPHGEKGSYFCPLDAEVTNLKTLVPLAEIYEKLDKCPASVKALLVDACRDDPLPKSGGMGLAKLNLESVTRPATEKAPEGVGALFSCSEGQEAYDSDKFKHGIFFHYVIEGLKGGAANKKGEVTLDGLASYVRDEVPDAAKEERGARAYQLPEMVGKSSGALPLVRRRDRRFFNKPETTEEYWLALQYEVEVGRLNLASGLLHALINKSSKQTELQPLVEKYGTGPFAQLSMVTEWSDDPKANMQARKDATELFDMAIPDKVARVKAIQNVADPQADMLVNQAIRQANKKALARPAEAIVDLKQVLDDIRGNLDISEKKRLELTGRLFDAAKAIKGPD